MNPSAFLTDTPDTFSQTLTTGLVGFAGVSRQPPFFGQEQKPKNCIHFVVDFLCKLLGQGKALSFAEETLPPFGAGRCLREHG